MSDYKTKNNTGALFNASDKKSSDKHPDYTGSAMVNGKLMSVASWINEAKSGKKYLSLKFSEFKPKSEETRAYTTNTTESADIPF